MSRRNKIIQPPKWAMGQGAKTWKGNEPCDHPGCMHHVTHPCEGCGRQWGQKNYTITEALTLVRDAALEGRKLEAWCEGENEWMIRFESVKEEWLWAAYGKGRRLYLYGELVAEFNTEDVFGTWHVREVSDE